MLRAVSNFSLQNRVVLSRARCGQSVRFKRSRSRLGTSTVEVQTISVPPEKDKITVKPFAAPKALTDFKDPIHITKEDVVDQELLESLSKQCDMEESASPLALACMRFKRQPQVLAILDCALSYCHIERMTFEEQSIVLHHVAVYCGNQALLFGDELRAACAFAQQLVTEYTLTQVMRITWALCEMLGKDTHCASLLQTISRRYRSRKAHLAGEHLLYLAKSLHHCRDNEKLVMSLHPMLHQCMMRRLDVASADDVVETLHILHEIKAIPPIEVSDIDRYCMTLRRDIKRLDTENLFRAAMLFDTLGFLPGKGDVLIVSLVDEFMSRAPTMSSGEFVLMFSSLVANCDLLDRQVQSCIPQLYQVISIAHPAYLVVLATAFSHSRIRRNAHLAFARTDIGFKILQNLQTFTGAQCVLLLHSFLHMRWKDIELLHLLAARAFQKHSLLSIDEICCLIHDFSLVRQEAGLPDAFCSFVADSDISKAVFSWTSGNRLIAGMSRLRFRHADWLSAMESFVWQNLVQYLQPDSTKQLATMVECLYRLDAVSKDLVKRLILSGTATGNVLERMPLSAQACLYLSAQSVNVHCRGWRPDLDAMSADDLKKLRPSLLSLSRAGS